MSTFSISLAISTLVEPVDGRCIYESARRENYGLYVTNERYLTVNDGCK